MVDFLPEVELMTQEEDLLEVSSETLVLQDLVWGLEQGEVAEVVVVVVVDLAEVVLDEAWVRSGVWLRIGLCVLNFLSILSDYTVVNVTIRVDTLSICRGASHM